MHDRNAFIGQNRLDQLGSAAADVEVKIGSAQGTDKRAAGNDRRQLIPNGAGFVQRREKERYAGSGVAGVGLFHAAPHRLGQQQVNHSADATFGIEQGDAHAGPEKGLQQNRLGVSQPITARRYRLFWHCETHANSVLINGGRAS